MTNQNDLRELYDAEYFDALPVDSIRIEQISQQLNWRADDRVCEFGSGLGQILISISDQIEFGLGVDFAEHAVEQAKKLTAKKQITNLTFRNVDIASLVDDESNIGAFDKVLMMDFTEHVSDADLLVFLEVAKSLLRADGKLILHTPNLGYYIERMKDHGWLLKQLPGHIAVRNEAQYSSLFEDAGFKLDSCTTLPHYRNPMRTIDRIMMHVPGVGRLFRSRLLITAAKRSC